MTKILRYMSLPKAILLDFDNTAYRYEPCHQGGMKAAHSVAAVIHESWLLEKKFGEDYLRAREAVKKLTEGQGARHCRLLYFKKLVETRFGCTDIAATRILHSAYWDGYFREMKLDPGLVETAGRLRAAGVRIAWVTNFTTERQMLKIRKLHVEKIAEFLITSEEAGADKPAENIFRLALSTLGVSPQEAVAIGDDFEADIRPARAMGMKTIWLKRDQKIAQLPDDVAVAADWADIEKLLFNEERQAA